VNQSSPAFTQIVEQLDKYLRVINQAAHAPSPEAMEDVTRELGPRGQVLVEVWQLLWPAIEKNVYWKEVAIDRAYRRDPWSVAPFTQMMGDIVFANPFLFQNIINLLSPEEPAFIVPENGGDNEKERSESQAPIQYLDIRKLDAEYRGFPTFEEWSKYSIDTDRWERFADRIKERKDIDPAILRRALETVRRVAAIQTGAIEKLYDAEWGFTITVAAKIAMWETVLSKKGSFVQSLIESQMEVYESILDFATGKYEIAPSWIRELHAAICKNQETYSAFTELGWQELSLPKGEYKSQPNHVIDRNDKPHAHAPVNATPGEMLRFCDELRSEAYQAAHPILQASYAHYALVRIHPFADGNGRVSRALASIFTMKANWIPVLILAEHRERYINTLMVADEGDYREFIDFIFERTLDAIQLVEQSLQTIKVPPIENIVSSFNRLYKTKGGYEHRQVDEAGYKLFDLFKEELVRTGNEIVEKTNIIFHVSPISTSDSKFLKTSSRWPIADGKKEIKLELQSKSPAKARIFRIFMLEVPKDCDIEDLLTITERNEQIIFEARITELIPSISSGLLLRLRMCLEGVAGETFKQLLDHAQKALLSKGY
jgi:Fic family protein